MSGDIINEINAQDSKVRTFTFANRQRTQKEKFFCISCNRLVRPPVLQLHCGHSSCGCCIDNLRKTSKHCPGNTRKCLDTDFTKKDHVVPAYYVERQLQKVELKCPNNIDGCPEILQYQNLNKHVKECEFNGNNNKIYEEDNEVCRAGNDKGGSGLESTDHQIKDLVEFKDTPIHSCSLVRNDMDSQDMVKTSTSIASANLLILIFYFSVCYYSSVYIGSATSPIRVETVNVHLNFRNKKSEDENLSYMIETAMEEISIQGFFHALSKGKGLTYLLNQTNFER